MREYLDHKAEQQQALEQDKEQQQQHLHLAKKQRVASPDPDETEDEDVSQMEGANQRTPVDQGIAAPGRDDSVTSDHVQENGERSVELGRERPVSLNGQFSNFSSALQRSSPLSSSLFSSLRPPRRSLYHPIAPPDHRQLFAERRTKLEESIAAQDMTIARLLKKLKVAKAAKMGLEEELDALDEEVEGFNEVD